MRKTYLLTLAIALGLMVKSQTTNDILNLLVTNGTIKQEQADSLRADAAIKQQEADAKKKTFNITSSKALQIGGYGQFRYQYLPEEKKPDGFDVRRAYVDIKGALNPAYTASVAIGKFATKVTLKIASQNKDDMIGIIYMSLNRWEHYPFGERKKDDVPDMTNNMLVDYSIFGFDE